MNAEKQGEVEPYSKSEPGSMVGGSRRRKRRSGMSKKGMSKKNMSKRVKMLGGKKRKHGGSRSRRRRRGGAPLHPLSPSAL